MTRSCASQTRRAARVALLTLAALATHGCERIEITALTRGAALPDARPAVAALHLRPTWFDAASGALPAELLDATRLQWQATTVISEMLDEQTELLLPDLMASFALEALAVTPGDGLLGIDATYAAPPLRASLRFKQSAGDTFCRVDLDLGPRQLAFDLLPAVRDGVPAWNTQLRDGLAGDGTLTWSPAETCPFDLQQIDWARIATRIDADLAAQTASTFMPALRERFVDQLALPRAGLRLDPRDSGFFWPESLSLDTRTSNMPPWPGDGLVIEPTTGLRASFDVELGFAPAACAAAVPEAPRDGAPLAPHGTPATTPARGAPYVAALVLDADFARALLHALGGAGMLCGDLTAAVRRELPPIDTFVTGLGELEGFDFGRRGRLRVQPTAGFDLEVVDPDTLRLTLEGLRVELYAESDDTGLAVRIALFEGRYELDLRPMVTATGSLAVDVVTNRVQLADSDVSLLESRGADIDETALASSVATMLVERSIAVPLPTPFGRTLSLVELEARSDGALWAYFSLAEAP